MKKIILFSFLIFIFCLVSFLGYVFLKPETLLNPSMLKFGLEKSKLLKSHSWSEGNLEWGYIAWNHRTLKGHFKDLCFEYDSEAIKIDTCIEELSWNIEIIGLTVKTIAPLVVHSSKLNVVMGKASEEKSPPPDVWKYWNMLWSDLTPDMDVRFKDIKITTAEKKKIQLDFKLLKQGKELNAEAMKYHLFANPEKFVVTAPAKIALPKKIPGLDTLYFRNFTVMGQVKKKAIKLEVAGFFEVAQVVVHSQIDLPLKDEFTSLVFLKKVALKTSANIDIPAFKKNLSFYAPDPFKELPAPLNVMDGKINIDIHTKNMASADHIQVIGKVKVDLKSEKQALVFDIDGEVPLSLKTYKPDSITAGLDFHQVQIQLPRLSKKSPPPQFIPDGRFKNRPFRPAVKSRAKPLDVTLHLEALKEKAVSFRTNLLDEILKLNFDLKIHAGKVQDGFVSVLPLKTSVFKRPIHLEKLKIVFDYPVGPVMEAVILFPLPEYKITLNLEGPVSKPRYSFTSEPPLPQNDIYAVLLFGRPMSELDSGDKSSAQQTNKLLSQGILSLSVLYFLAGSPVEYVGYDSGSKTAFAQFGLDDKTSLRVGGGGEGVNSSSIRRSLGKGWYLDTTVQSSSETSSNDSKNYGVLLERIISY